MADLIAVSGLPGLTGLLGEQGLTVAVRGDERQGEQWVGLARRIHELGSWERLKAFTGDPDRTQVGLSYGETVVIVEHVTADLFTVELGLLGGERDD